MRVKATMPLPSPEKLTNLHLSDNRDQLDALFCQFPKIKLLAEGVAKEATVAMHGDNFECVVAVAGALDHLLENRSLVVGSCRSSFDKLRHGLMAVGIAPCQNLRALVRDRQVMLPLSIRHPT